MAVSKVDIVNKSLTLIGAQPITSLDDGSAQARVASRVYEISLRSILSECKWNFATKRSLLSVSADTLAWYETGLTVVYVRPTDVVKIFDTSDPKAKWKVEGDYIISDTTGLGIRYVYYLDDPSKYPSYFVDALVDKLCSDIGYSVVNSDTLGEKFKGLYERITLPKAMSLNSQVGDQQAIDDDAWEVAKYHNIQVEA